MVLEKGLWKSWKGPARDIFLALFLISNPFLLFSIFFSPFPFSFLFFFLVFLFFLLFILLFLNFLFISYFTVSFPIYLFFFSSFLPFFFSFFFSIFVFLSFYVSIFFSVFSSTLKGVILVLCALFSPWEDYPVPDPLWDARGPGGNPLRRPHGWHSCLHRPGEPKKICTANEGLMRIQHKCLVPINVFPKQNYDVLFSSSYTDISVRDLYISKIGLPILLQENMWTDPVNI